MANYTTNVAANFLVPCQFYTAGPSSVISWDPMSMRVKTPNGYIQNYSGFFGVTYSGIYMYLSWPNSTLTGVTTYSATGALLESYSGMSVPGNVYQSYVQANNSVGLNTYIFRGNDAITGSNFRDVLRGYTGDDVLNGRAGNDTLYGDAGNDTLNGGIGGDVLIGGVGDDIYVVDSLGDRVVESLAGGIDTIQSSRSFTLVTLPNIENLTLVGIASINGFGNNFDNILTGNAAHNVLRGGAGNDTLFGGAGNDALCGDTGNNMLYGGAGNDTLDSRTGIDTLAGGSGNDVYFVDNLLDVIVENSLEGVDTIQTGMSYSLATLPNVENLTLTGLGAINGTGNNLSNIIIGNSSNNVLDGGGWVDTLIGGLGDDTYIVDNAGDSIRELAAAGIDTVLSSASFDLRWGGNNVENLTLTGGLAIDGTGNALSNVIVGNDVNNVLDGGAGRDILTGNLGNDTFSFGAALNGTIDTITDFAAGDHIQLSMSGVRGLPIFWGLPSTNANGIYIYTFNLNAEGLVVGAGPVANAANAQILYDTTTGTLSFDSDGTGAVAAVAFAQLTGAPALANTDFILI